MRNLTLARMLAGPGPLPPGARLLGIAYHPRDGAAGARVRLASGVDVHIAAGVLRSLPKEKRPCASA